MKLRVVSTTTSNDGDPKPEKKVLLKAPVASVAAEALVGNRPPEETIYINDSLGVKSGKYPKSKIINLIKAAKAIGVNPHQALALGLQETGFATHKNKTGQGAQGRRNRSSLGSVNPDLFDDNDIQTLTDLQSQGYDSEALALSLALKKKMAYAKQLGYNDEAMQLQGYNGYGTVTKDTFGGADKAYGVPIGSGIDMKKNPLYGKRLVQLKNDLMNNKELAALFN
jgi:hypothetical protein